MTIKLTENLMIREQELSKGKETLNRIEYTTQITFQKRSRIGILKLQSKKESVVQRASPRRV
jgi:hypothetical protein